MAVVKDAVYTELINQIRPHTTVGLRFSRKASAAMLHRNYWKIINFLAPMPNAGRCQFDNGDGDVYPNTRLEAYLYQEESLSIFLFLQRQRLLFLGYRRLLS